MNLGDFTEKDYELLMEALDAWEKAPVTDSMVDSIIGSGFGREEGRETRVKAALDAASAKGKARRSIAILLRAKLELARQSAQAAALKTTEEDR